MKTLSRFVTKFTSLIIAVLSCFDRVIFKGYLPVDQRAALEGFVDHVLKILRRTSPSSPRSSPRPWSNTPSGWPMRPAQEYRYLQGFHRKDKLVNAILRQRPHPRGLGLRLLLHGVPIATEKKTRLAKLAGGSVAPSP